MEVREVKARTILVRSKLPEADYVINPYTGCSFGCVYCYASFMGRFVGEPVDNWGNYVFAKINAPEVLASELAALSAKNRHRRILLSSVTDAYQHAERKYEITRRILETLCRERYPGLISILTKSSLVLRDLDLLKQLPSVEVGFTVTTTDDQVSRALEVRAPRSSDRLAALKAVHESGIETYAFVGPLLPHFYGRPELLEQLLSEIAESGVTSVFVEHMNLRPYIRERLVSLLGDEGLDSSRFVGVEAEIVARDMLDHLVRGICEQLDISLRLGRVLSHGEQS